MHIWRMSQMINIKTGRKLADYNLYISNRRTVAGKSSRNII